MRPPFFIILFFITTEILAESVPTSIKEHVTSQMEGHVFFSGKLSDWAERTRQFYIKHASSENIYATFTPPDPWSVVIDFNGDSKNDWIGFLVRQAKLDESEKRRVSLYCICTTSKGYEDILLMKWAWTVYPDNLIGVGVFPVPAGPKISQFEFQPDANIPNPGVWFMNYEKGSRIFYWDEGEVKTFTMSD